ncbi:MAG TPA: type II secretion system F family protein [Vicinamibacterales bacterium]|nr:type II secretion system F family protein [Vicinamibacterales bacterium]
MNVFVIATFAGVLLIVLGSYWAVIVRSETQEQSHLRKRLKARGTVLSARVGGVMRQDRPLSSVKHLEGVLGRVAVVLGPTQRLIEQADSRMSVGLLVVMTGTAALMGYLVVTLFVPFRALAALAGLIFAMGPYVYLRWRRSRRLLQFEEKFPEAIELIARALRAGHAFTTGLSMVADEIPAPVGSEFRLLYDRQNFGMPLPEALRGFAQRIPLLDARFFATAVLTQREAGGNLSEVLDNLARVVRERFKVKRQVRVVSAHARITGWVLVALPPATAVAFMLIVPDTIKLLVTDPVGVRMVAVAIFLQITGGLIVKKLVNIEY